MLWDLLLSTELAGKEVKRSLLILIITSSQVGSAICPVLGGVPTVNHRLAEMEVKDPLVIFICFFHHHFRPRGVVVGDATTRA